MFWQGVIPGRKYVLGFFQKIYPLHYLCYFRLHYMIHSKIVKGKNALMTSTIVLQILTFFS